MSEQPARRVPPTSPPGRRRTQPTVMTLVIYAVAAAMLLSLLVIGALAWAGKPIPDPLGSVPGVALTGLVALLANRRADL